MASHHKVQDHVKAGKYDAVLRVERLTDVYDWNRGWKVDVNPDSLDALARSTAVRVAPIGVCNAGKTWLIKKLCGNGGTDGLTSAPDVHEEGLSVNISYLGNDVGNVCFLDTAGLKSPVTPVTARNTTTEAMEAMEEMLQEPKRQENFIRRVAFEFAQVYVLVVGQITHRDQLELLQLVEQVQRASATKKQVIVVHNLKTMTDKDFRSTSIDAQTNISYRDCMSKVFSLTMRNQKVVDGSDTAHVDELCGVFGETQNSELDNAVLIRHVFLTSEAVDAQGTPVDPACKNRFVIRYIRQLIQATTPTCGNVLRDIAKIASACVKNMVHLPPGKTIEIRYHEERRVLLGGKVRAEELETVTAQCVEAASTTAVTEAADRLKLLRDALLADPNPSEAEPTEFDLEMELVQLRIAALAQMKRLELDGRTLLQLHGPITARHVALGAVTSRDGHVKFNVTRTRALVLGQPFWVVFVHMTVPGMAAGQLGRLKGELQWDRGVTMEGLTPQSPETLKIRFKVRVLPMPAKQFASLNRSSVSPLTVDKRMPAGAITIDPVERAVVIAAGNRPFPTGGATFGAAKEGMREDGSFELDVVVHTKVENCVWDFPPLLRYSRGVLSLVVCAEPTEEELLAPANEDWSNGNGCPVGDPLALFFADASEPDDLPDEAATERQFYFESYWSLPGLGRWTNA